MAKIVDITEKLSFDTNPVIRIKDVEIEVNADAMTMLEIMGNFKTKSSTDAALSSVEKLFKEKERKKLDKMNLSFKDYMTVIAEAMSLIQGDSTEDGQGE